MSLLLNSFLLTCHQTHPFHRSQNDSNAWKHNSTPAFTFLLITMVHFKLVESLYVPVFRKESVIADEKHGENTDYWDEVQLFQGCALFL